MTPTQRSGIPTRQETPSRMRALGPAMTVANDRRRVVILPVVCRSIAWHVIKYEPFGGAAPFVARPRLSAVAWALPIAHCTWSARASGPSTLIPFARSASFSLLPEAACEAGRPLCPASDSASGWPSRRARAGHEWPYSVSRHSDLGRSSTHWAGLWSFAQESAWCSPLLTIPPLPARIRAE
jgi:hypothetical protein